MYWRETEFPQAGVRFLKYQCCKFMDGKTINEQILSKQTLGEFDSMVPDETAYKRNWLFSCISTLISLFPCGKYKFKTCFPLQQVLNYLKTRSTLRHQSLKILSLLNVVLLSRHLLRFTPWHTTTFLLLCLQRTVLVKWLFEFNRFWYIYSYVCSETEVGSFWNFKTLIHRKTSSTDKNF